MKPISTADTSPEYSSVYQSHLVRIQKMLKNYGAQASLVLGMSMTGVSALAQNAPPSAPVSPEVTTIMNLGNANDPVLPIVTKSSTTAEQEEAREKVIEIEKLKKGEIPAGYNKQVPSSSVSPAVVPAPTPENDTGGIGKGLLLTLGLLSTALAKIGQSLWRVKKIEERTQKMNKSIEEINTFLAGYDIPTSQWEDIKVGARSLLVDRGDALENWSALHGDKSYTVINIGTLKYTIGVYGDGNISVVIRNKKDGSVVSENNKLSIEDFKGGMEKELKEMRIDEISSAKDTPDDNNSGSEEFFYSSDTPETNNWSAQNRPIIEDILTQKGVISERIYGDTHFRIGDTLYKITYNDSIDAMEFLELGNDSEVYSLEKSGGKRKHEVMNFDTDTSWSSTDKELIINRIDQLITALSPEPRNNTVDPLTEADVYLDYGRYSQAFDILFQALKVEDSIAMSQRSSAKRDQLIAKIDTLVANTTVPSYPLSKEQRSNWAEYKNALNTGSDIVWPPAELTQPPSVPSIIDFPDLSFELNPPSGVVDTPSLDITETVQPIDRDLIAAFTSRHLNKDDIAIARNLLKIGKESIRFMNIEGEIMEIMKITGSNIKNTKISIGFAGSDQVSLALSQVDFIAMVNSAIDHLGTLLVTPTPAPEVSLEVVSTPEVETIPSQPTPNNKSSPLEHDLSNLSLNLTSASLVETKKQGNIMTQNSEMIQGILKRLEIPVDLINPSKELTSIMVNIGGIEYDIVCSGEDGEDEIFIYTPDNTLLGRNGLISIDRIGTTFSSADVDLLKEIFSNLRNPANPPLETKYALAQEFIAIGDRTGASKLLEEVIGNKDTDGSLRVQAEATLAEITPKVQIIRD